MKYPSNVTNIFKNYLLYSQEKSFIDSIPQKGAFDRGEDSFRFHHASHYRRRTHYYSIYPKTLSIRIQDHRGTYQLKTRVPHSKAINYLMIDTDGSVLDELSMLGLSDLVKTIRDGKYIPSRKVAPVRRSIGSHDRARKVFSQIPSKGDFSSGKECYTLTSCYPRHAYIFNISRSTISVIGRSAGGGHELLRSGPWINSLDVLASEIDTAGLFELRGLGLQRLVELVRKRKHTMKKCEP